MDVGSLGLHPIPVLVAAFLLAFLAYREHRRFAVSERAHREELEQYLDLASAMLVVIDRDGRVRTANRKACEVFGRDEAEMTGADWFTTVVAAQDRELSRQSFERIFAGRVPRGRSERNVARPDGTERLVEWEFATRTGSDGRVLSVLASGQDITDRRAAETQLAGLRRLAQDVAENDDARQLVVDHAFALLGAESVVLVQAGMITASRSSERAAGDDTNFVRTPVTLNGDTVAELEVSWSDDDDGGGSRHADLQEILAQEMATALGRLDLLATLERKAVRDALTGIPNRRALDDELPRTVARATRTGEPFSIAALDLNSFKALNDTEGHEAGDRALKACAAAWSAELRVTDLLVRLGGDEFVALLPDCPEGRATQVAERLRCATPHRGGSSVGVVTHHPGELGEDLLRRADQALYADKARSRADRLTDPVRLAAVARTGLTHGELDAELDEITRTTQWLLEVPTATVNLLEADRLAFASQCGLAPELAARGGLVSASFCQHAVTTGEPLIIGDTRHDVRVEGNPAIDEGVLAYAGIPLNDPEGNVLGVLCVFDGEPRAWSDTEVATLKTLADRAAARLAERIGSTSASVR